MSCSISTCRPITTCSICGYINRSISAYSVHINLHKHIPNANYACGVHDCCRLFQNFSSFKCHIFRDHIKSHTRSAKALTLRSNFTLSTFHCQVRFCTFSCSDVSKLYSHLRQHIKLG